MNKLTTAFVLALAVVSLGSAQSEKKITAEVNKVGVSGKLTQDMIGNFSESNGSRYFEGKLRTPTPCYNLNSTVKTVEGTERLVISPYSTRGICTQQVVMQKYNATVKSNQGAELEVYHGDKRVGNVSLSVPAEKDDSKESSNSILSWIKSLLGLL